MTLQKKVLIIFCVVLGLCIVVVGYIFLSSKQKKTDSKTGSINSLEQLLETRAISSTVDTLTLDNTDEYNTSYNKVTKEFLIVLMPSEKTNSKLEQDRVLSETSLLEITALDSKAICSQKISEIVAPSYWTEISGIDYGFSSCPGSLIFNQ